MRQGRDEEGGEVGVAEERDSDRQVGQLRRAVPFLDEEGGHPVSLGRDVRAPERHEEGQEPDGPDDEGDVVRRVVEEDPAVPIAAEDRAPEDVGDDEREINAQEDQIPLFVLEAVVPELPQRFLVSHMIKKKFAEKDRDHSKEEGAQNQTRKAGWVHFSLLLFE